MRLNAWRAASVGARDAQSCRCERAGDGYRTLHDGCVGKQGTSGVEKNSWGCATRARRRRRKRCVCWQLCCSRAAGCCVSAAAAGVLAYADGMSCTCGTFASAGSSLASPSATIGAFSESGICRCEGGGTELTL